MRPLALLSTAFCPPIWYTACIVQLPSSKIEKCENYQKRTARNRCYIQSSQGPLLISVPLAKGKNQQCPITAVQTETDSKWYNETSRSIRSSYNKAPYYDYYSDSIFQYLKEYSESNSLWIANSQLCKKIYKLIGLEHSFTSTERYISFKDLTEDVLDLRHLKLRHGINQEQFIPQYEQTFTEKQGFQSDLSILDLIMELGPASLSYLESYPLNL